MSNNQPAPDKDEATEKILKELREKFPQNAKIRVINLKEVQNVYQRLGKISNFHYIGAILCLIVGLYYAQEGSHIIPIVLGSVMFFNMIFALLAYKATTKIERFLELVKKGQKH